MRQAASQALDACRAAYPPNQLCAVLCPRVLEFPPGRARTGLFEFLAVILPHASSFLSNQGNLHALTQRLAAALLQSPPPVNWDGNIGGGGGGASKRDNNQNEGSGGAGGGNGGGGGISAGAAYSAAARVLAALFRLDRDALLAASGSLTSESAAAVRRALDRAVPDANAISTAVPRAPAPGSSRQQQEQQRRPPETFSSSSGEVVAPQTGAAPGSPPTCASAAGSPSVLSPVSSSPPSPANSSGYGETAGDGAVRSPVVCAAANPLAAAAKSSPFSSSTPMGSPADSSGAQPVSSPGFDSTTPGAWVGGRSEASVRDAGTGGGGITFPQTDVALSTPLQQDQRQNKQRREQGRHPLAVLTPRDVNTMVTPVSTGGGGRKIHKVADSKKQYYATPSTSSATATASSPRLQQQQQPQATPPRPPTRGSQSPSPKASNNSGEDDPAEVARTLMAGLSTTARTRQKMSALASLRVLADGGGGAGGGTGSAFWSRYFGQVLILLLEGASTTAVAGGGDMGSSPSRKRATLAGKHVQGVRCLVARRGALFPEATEMVVERMVEIGGKGCHHVRLEAEACLVDLVAVLEPSRYLAVLVPLLMLPAGDGRVSGMSVFHCCEEGCVVDGNAEHAESEDRPVGLVLDVLVLTRSPSFIVSSEQMPQFISVLL